MKILHLDKNHSLLIEQLAKAGFENIEDYDCTYEQALSKMQNIDGIVIRSRIKLDAHFLENSPKLKFIGRVGAGLESIDTVKAKALGIALFSAPEGNRNAVGEHALGMLLSLTNHLNRAHRQVTQGQWNREANRGIELEGKTVGIIGYGNMGKAFAKKLQGFDCHVICYDILPNVGDAHAQQVSLEAFKALAQVVSLHTPWTPETNKMIDANFIAGFAHPFYFINTARGKSVVTADLVAALKSGQILGAGLDVLEYEKSSFESLFNQQEMPQALKDLIAMDQVLLSPHIAGWTVESKKKLAQTIVDKILAQFSK